MKQNHYPKIIPILTYFVLLLGTACQKQHEVMIFADMSASMPAQNEKNIELITTRIEKDIERLDAITSLSGYGVRTTCYSVGSDLLPSKQSWELPACGISLFRSVPSQQDSIATFLERCQNGLSAILQTTPQEKHTCLYESVCYGLQELENKEAAHTIIILSDFIQDCQNVNLGTKMYTKHPERILKQRDTIRETLRKHDTLPQLNGANVILICSDKKGKGNPTHYASKLFKEMLLDAGAKEVKIVKSL